MKHVGAIVSDHRFKFLLVGGTNTVVGYVVYGALYQFVFRAVPLGYVISLVISYAISIVLAFYLYRRFVFKVTGHVVRDFIRFVGVYAVAITVNIVALPVLVEFAHVPPLIAQLIVIVATTLLSYFGHREVSFRRPAEPGAEDEAQTRAGNSPR
ncbi:MAG: GtrA family protein [Actinobacteria bacterium]|nr:GtrA family protein [Actinomycetota bacterium]